MRLLSIARSGAREITPMVLALVPFALAIGAAADRSSLPTGPASAGGVLIMAGSAQMAAIEMFDAGVASMVIILSALVINLRLVLYSASMAAWFPSASALRRLVLAMPLIDTLYLSCKVRFDAGDLDERERMYYYAGSAVWLLAAWVGVQQIAIFAGSSLPDALLLELGAPLAMTALVAKHTTNSPTGVTAVAASAVVVMLAGTPFSGAILVGIIAGTAAGWTVQGRCATVGAGGRS